MTPGSHPSPFATSVQVTTSEPDWSATSPSERCSRMARALVSFVLFVERGRVRDLPVAWRLTTLDEMLISYTV